MFNGTVVIIADGGCENNGAANARAFGSYLLRAVKDRTIVRETRSGRLNYPQHTTNNQAEMQTLIEALKVLAVRIPLVGNDYPVVVYMDSQIVVNLVSGTWSANNATLKTMLQEAKELIAQFPQFKIEWVRRDKIVQALGH